MNDFRLSLRTGTASAAVLLASAHPGAAAAADEGFAPITPYRPSVSSPAQLPAAGQLEAEVGGLRARSDDLRRSSIPLTLKLAFDPQWGLVLGGEGHVWQQDLSQGSDVKTQGAGDTTLLIKRAWTVDDATAYGLELGTKRPTAGDGIGSGRADYSLNSIASRDIGPVHLDANVNATRLGAIDPGTSRTQFGASASFSGAISERFGITGELSGTRRSGAPSSVQWLAALTFSPSKLLTIDIGLARATQPSPATMQWFAGAVFPIAKLW